MIWPGRGSGRVKSAVGDSYLAELCLRRARAEASSATGREIFWSSVSSQEDPRSQQDQAEANEKRKNREGLNEEP